MTQTLNAIDISDHPDLLRLIDKLRGIRSPIVLRLGGEPIAVVTLTEGATDAPTQSRRLTEAERAAFLASAGGWNGLVDVEEFKANNAESRRISPRPPVDL